jgi:ryanodine receptor 2
MVHDAWLKTKLSQGYTFGAVKDDCEKKHPCILPYEELPQHEKFKNQMFIAIVKAMI